MIPFSIFRRLRFAGIVLCAAASPVLAATLIEAGRQTEWRYFDSGSNPGAAWHSPSFDDAKWRQGRAPLGYGEPDVVTTVRFGADERHKHVTTYFRREFEVSALAAIQQLVFVLRLDDGAVVYLNGREMLRSNLPAGPIAAATYAAQKVQGSEEGRYQRHVVPATALVAGRNVLAVEVHQSDAGSTDLFFDLLLKTYGAGEEPVAARVAPTARATATSFLEKHTIAAGTRIPDGYVDGGRQAKLTPEGAVQTGREVMVVDRARDAVLQRQLEYARSPVLARMPALERATLLALYVDREYSSEDGRRFSANACAVMEGEYRGRELLIGRSAGAGACRHRSLVFKLLADEAGLAVALVRGNLGPGGAHAWNELGLEDGEKRIVDVMNPRPGFYFPKTDERAAADYLTVKNQPYYPVVRR